MTEYEMIKNLESRVDSLCESIRQMAINQTPVTAKADEAAGKVPQINENASDILKNSADIDYIAMETGVEL